jgi:hypothetical protein
LACLATLTGLFYAVENWRGKRAWEKCRRELEAKGEVLDWNAFIPAPVPDEQNIFKAPKMAEWFVKGSLAEAFPTGPSKPGNTNAPFSLLPSWNTKSAPVLLAEVDVVPTDGPLPPGKADAVWRYDDPASHEQAAKLLDDLAGPRMNSPQGGVIVTRPLDRTNPLHLVLRADIKPTIPGLSAFLSPGAASENKGTASGRSYFQSSVETTRFKCRWCLQHIPLWITSSGASRQWLTLTCCVKRSSGPTPGWTAITSSPLSTRFRTS